MSKRLRLTVAIALGAGLFLPKLGIGAFKMTTKTAYTLKEPLLIAGDQQHYSILPAGTVLYYDRAWPEGHQTYHVFFHFKGDFKAVPADPEMISPLWLRTIDPEELPNLLNDYPVTKDELVKILKARKITKAELLQIARDWPGD
jgi:hypothetical protein